MDKQITIKKAIEEGLIQKRFGGWGCYQFNHPEFDSLCKLAGEQNQIEAEAKKEKEEIEKANQVAHQKWWDSLEKIYIRFGKAPKNGKSFNHRDSFHESGVSCYQAAIDENKKIHIKSELSALLTGPGIMQRPAYQVFGKEIGIGSDGEPILEIQKLKRIKGRKIVFPIFGEIISK